jgi:tripartite motif-containing protein 71
VGCSIRQEVVRVLTALAFVSALILVFSSQAGAASGTWERSWGKGVNGGAGFEVCTVASICQTGTNGALGGEIQTASDVAVDGAGNVYVADTLNNRIQKYDSSGVWQRAWGRGVNGGAGFEVCTVASSCLIGSTGTLGGEMNNPGGVATDASGNVYVADFLNHRIQKFDSSGGFVAAWGKDVSNLAGTGFEICTVAANCQIGQLGTLGGEMRFPVKVGTDASGNVYVSGDQRIQKFNSSGVWERAWGKDVVAGNAETGFEVCPTATPASCQADNTGILGGEFDGAQDLATDASGFVYVADQVNNRIQKFNGATGAWNRAWGWDVDVGGGTTDFEICTVITNCQDSSTGGGLGGGMNSPAGVAVDGSGNVYVSETTGQRIQKFDSSGNWQRAWGKNVNGGGVFGICTVASSCLAGSPGTLGGELNQATGLGTDASGNLYVAEQSSRRISKFADPPLSPTPPSTTLSTLTPPPTSSFTGLRALAIKKCKKKFPKGPRRTKCIKKAKRLPL